jgi:hypothetical protein
VTAGWKWFWAWAVVGAGLALAIVSLGPLLALPVGVIAFVMARRPAIRRSSFGALAGGGLVLLFIAYLQRDGPGTTCWRTNVASGCSEHLNPIPWLVLGFACLLGGFIGQARRYATERRLGGQ